MRWVRGFFIMGVIGVAAACASDDTGYTLNITAADTEGRPKPSQLVISCFVGDKVTVNNEGYPKPREVWEFADGQVAQIGIDADPAIVGERRFWVRAVQAGNMAVLAEAVAKAPTAVEGKRPVIEMALSWNRLPDEDSDGVPNQIDNCPQVPNPEQGPCPGAQKDAGAPQDAAEVADAANAADAASNPTNREDAAPSLDAGVF